MADEQAKIPWDSLTGEQQQALKVVADDRIFKAEQMKRFEAKWKRWRFWGAVVLGLLAAASLIRDGLLQGLAWAISQIPEQKQ